MDVVGANMQPQSPGTLPSVWTFGRAELDELRRELRVDGRAVALETKPYELLRVFVQHVGETLSKDELLDAVWPGRVVTEGVLAKCVTKLRSALADDQQQIIKTLHGFGYRFVLQVSARAAVAATMPSSPHAGDELPARPHWRFARELGGGGFGEVWLIEHVKTHERRVIKFATDGTQLHALKREITLYRLLHDTLGERAHVARILDWNVDEPPYCLEAEYAPGGNLLEWCEARGGGATVPTVWRIEMVARVAEALAAVHAIGVLHKDLKPANVLVIPQDDACPQVRLNDFGSGRALEPERLVALGITRLGLTNTQTDGSSTSGTAFYLAPELVAGQAPTLRADVYALGVMLYQFLVGDFRRPLAPGWERDIDDEFLREDIALAADVDPECRLGDAGDLARRLRALGSRAAQRAQERAAVALAESQHQQLLRWHVRRRWLLALCTVLAMAAAIGTSLYLRAEREAAIAKAVNSFLDDDLLAAANPYHTQQRDLRVRDVLDRARDAVGERFGGRPAEEAAIRTTLGRSYSGIGDYSQARRQLQRARELGVAAQGERGEEVFAVRRALADNDMMDSHYADAEREYMALASDLGVRHAPESIEMLDLGVARAHLAWRSGHPEDAAKALEQLLPHLRDHVGADGELRLSALSDLGQAYRTMARFDQAATAYSEVYAARRKRLGDGHYATLQALQDLAQLERSRGHLDKAVEFEQAVLAGREKIFGREHEETQNALNELASMYQDQDRYVEAEPLFREVLAVRERTLGEQHENTRNSLNNLGLVLSLEGKLDEAEGYLRRALEIERKLLGADNLDVLILMHNLAGLERDRADYAQAESLHREVISRAAHVLTPERPENGLFLVGFAQTLQKQKRYQEAADTFAAARKNLLAAYGPTHARVAKLHDMQVTLYKQWGRPMPDVAD